MSSEREIAQALLSSYEPSLRDRVGNAIYDIAQALGMGSTANRMRNEGTAVLDFIPGVGDAVGVDDAYRDYQAGNYGLAAVGLGLTAAGAIPGVGDAVGKGIRVWTGGMGDPLKAAVDKGAWFSEVEDLAREYAGQIGHVTPATIRPINPIEFRHAEQSRTIGDIISTALEGNIRTENLDAAIPLVESLRAKYGDTSMPLFEYWNNDKEVADLFRALGYDSISAAEKSNMAAKTWGALDPSILSMEAVPDVGDAVANAGRKGIRAFHSSRADFDRFQPSPHRGASFFASTPNRARSGGGAGQSEMVMETASAYDKDPRPLRTYEVNIDPEHIEGLNYTPAEREWFDSLPSEVIGDDALEDVLKNKPMNIQDWDDVYEPAQVGERLFKYIKKPQPPSISYEEAYRRGRDIYGRQHAHWGPQSDEVRTAERVKARGMKGYLINDEAGLSIAVIDPAIIEIVRKYGLAGAVAAGLISQEMAAQMQEQGMGEI